MKNKLLQLSMMLVAILLVACGGNGTENSSTKSKRSRLSIFTPTASGRAFEILVVCDADVWERPAGRALYNVLDTDVPGLPQPERSFHIMNTTPSGYNATLKMLRNIIKVEIDGSIYTQPKFRAESDVYAFPQNILNIQAPDEASFEEYVSKNGQAIIDYFTHSEMNRQIMVLAERHSNLISTKLKEMFGCDVWLPGELKSTKSGVDFFWAGTNSATADRNFVMYSYPYKDKRTFTKEFFVQKRDSVMKENIQGAREGMYMQTDSLFTTVKSFMLKGGYVFEARGLWRVKGDFMGGPYVSQARVDTVNHKVVVEEVFIYSPDRLKRNLMRQMEASLYTIQLPEEADSNKEIPLVVEK